MSAMDGRAPFRPSELRLLKCTAPPGICALDGLLYVCGGYDGASCLNSMERFDPLTGVWTSCPAMLLRRRYCRLAVLGES